MKITIGLFFGGDSVEHEVSIISGLQALHHFDMEKYNVLPIYITREHQFYTGTAVTKVEEYRDIPALLKKSTRVILTREGDRVCVMAYGSWGIRRKPLAVLDVAFPVVHGTNVEDGSLQGYFRTLGLAFAGCDVGASALGMDKYAQKLLYAAAGLPVLPALRFLEEQERTGIPQRVEKEIGYPVVVKPADLGSSVGIRLAHNADELTDAMDYAFAFSPTLLVEKAVPQLRELNCSVLGDRNAAEASELEEPVMGDEILSYKDKYESGGGQKGMSSLKRLLPAPVDEKLRESVRQMAVTAFQCLGCSGVARIDFLMDRQTGEYWVNEVNTIPGSLSFYLWEPLGLSYGALLDRLVSLALKRSRELSRFRNTVESGILKNFDHSGSKGSKGSKL